MTKVENQKLANRLSGVGKEAIETMKSIEKAIKTGKTHEAVFLLPGLKDVVKAYVLAVEEGERELWSDE
jgi:hypothetical protein